MIGDGCMMVCLVILIALYQVISAGRYRSDTVIIYQLDHIRSTTPAALPVVMKWARNTPRTESWRNRALQGGDRLPINPAVWRTCRYYQLLR